MRHLSRVLLVTALGGLPVACSNRANVQCEVDPNCDLSTGGICAAASNGNHWCAYPDPSCPGGYRYTGQDVGDGLAGVCVAQTSDGGIDPGATNSCKALPHTCGASGNDDCCNSLPVKGGTYYRSLDKAADSFSGDMSSPATISDLRLDKYEVTVGRFRAFALSGPATQSSTPAIGDGAHPKIPGSGWEASWNTNLAPELTMLKSALKCGGTSGPTAMLPTWTDIPGTNENRPISCVTWYEAMAFCAWDGGWLPSETEWNYAATGGDDQRAFPWSSPPSVTNTLDPAHASYEDDQANCPGDGMPACTVADLVPVGSKPPGDGRWNQSDLAGNVAEWTLDWYAPYTPTCSDCANLVVAEARVFRGGSFYNTSVDARTGRRGSLPPASRSVQIGFRCARAP